MALPSAVATPSATAMVLPNTTFIKTIHVPSKGELPPLEIGAELSTVSENHAPHDDGDPYKTPPQTPRRVLPRSSTLEFRPIASSPGCRSCGPLSARDNHACTPSRTPNRSTLRRPAPIDTAQDDEPVFTMYHVKAADEAVDGFNIQVQAALLGVSTDDLADFVPASLADGNKPLDTPVSTTPVRQNSTLDRQDSLFADYKLPTTPGLELSTMNSSFNFSNRGDVSWTARSSVSEISSHRGSLTSSNAVLAVKSRNELKKRQKELHRAGGVRKVALAMKSKNRSQGATPRQGLKQVPKVV